MNNFDEADEDPYSYPKTVERWSVYCYGVGHMLNDITAACWFTYLLVFLSDIGLTPRYKYFQQFVLDATHFVRCSN